MKANPEELKAFSEDFDRLRQDHQNIINAEPILKGYMDSAEKFAKKRYEDLKES